MFLRHTSVFAMPGVTVALGMANLLSAEPTVTGGCVVIVPELPAFGVGS